MARTTPLMLRAEAQLGGPLSAQLPAKVNELGISGAALELGVSKSTINYWMLKLGISVSRVAVSPREEIIITKQL